MIEQHIVQALLSRDSVTLTHFGTFSKERVPARIEDGKILPPHYLVEFHSMETGNPLDFLAEVAKIEKISLLDADAKVRAWTENVLQTLDQEQRLHLENFGTFAGNASYFSFACDELPGLNEDFEGMDSIEVQTPVPVISAPSEIAAEETENMSAESAPVAEEQPTEDLVAAPVETSESEDLVAAPVAEEQLPEESVAAPVETSESEDLVTEQPAEPEQAGGELKQKSHKWISVLFFILLILASIAFLLYIFREPLQMKYNELKDRYFQKEEIVADTLVTTQEEPVWMEEDTTLSFPDSLATDSLANEIEPAEEIQPEPVPVTHSAPVTKSKVTQSFPRLDFEQGRFYVIAGSFSSLEKATQHAQWKASQGFTPSLLYQSGTSKIRICVAIFNSEAEANTYLANHQGFWILQ